MLNVNDDMDEFLKRAAEDYPLKIGKGNWDDVAAAIGNDAAVISNKNYRKAWWLLLLLPLIIAVAVYDYHSTGQGVSTGIAATAPSAPAAKDVSVAGKAPATIQADAGSTAAAAATTTKPQPLPEQQEPASGKNSKQTNEHLSFIKTYIRATGEKTITDQQAVLQKNMLPQSNPAAAAAVTTITTHKTQNNSLVLQAGDITNGAGNNTNLAIINQIDSVGKTDKQDAATQVVKTNSRKAPLPKQIGFYAGIAVSADATTVKFHSIKHIGNTFSILAGYRINNTWSVETGLMWDKKKYYSTGKYFDKANAGLSPDYDIHYLNGDCKMLEIPLNVKYDFKSKKRSGFYIAAGVSSYFMKREGYNYFVTHLSEPAVPGYYSSRDYKNTTSNIFAITNLSGGYQFIFKNNSALRIEPYFKIPVSGLGVGKLPLTSTGIAAAYTLPLH